MSGFEKRGFVRKSARYSDGPQRKLLAEKGIKAIYGEGDGETLAGAVRSLRRGDELWVMRLDRISATRGGLRKAIQDVHARGVVIVEAVTGRRSDSAGQLAGMIFDAFEEIAADRRVPSPEEARKRGLLGGRPRTQRMGKRQARAIWKDRRSYPTSIEAASAMTGWSVATAYREFGRRETVSGPRKRKSK